MSQDDNPEFLANEISCTGCLWRHPGGTTCDAFKKGIPIAILLGAFDHRHFYDDGDVDDGGLTFTPAHDVGQTV